MRPLPSPSGKLGPVHPNAPERPAQGHFFVWGLCEARLDQEAWSIQESSLNPSGLRPFVREKDPYPPISWRQGPEGRWGVAPDCSRFRSRDKCASPVRCRRASAHADLASPDVRGRDACHRLRAECPRMPIGVRATQPPCARARQPRRSTNLAPPSRSAQ